MTANSQAELAGVFSTYAADTPQVFLDIDRDKAQVLSVRISDIFNALQSTLGSYYINDFNVFGRTWQVNLQAETSFRKRIDEIQNIYVRNARGGMVPMRALAEAKLVQGPQTVVRYNGYRAAIVNGAPKPGYSSGQGLAAMERISAATLPSGYSFEWTGTAFQEKAAGGRTIIVLGLAMLFAYLFLVALYESWNIPVPALLSVSVAILGALVAVAICWVELRHICADRSGGAHRTCRQERHFDCGIRGRAAAARQRHLYSGHRSGRFTFSSSDDDELCLHLWAVSACHRTRGWRRYTPRSGHTGFRRHDRGINLRHFRYSAAVRHRGTIALSQVKQKDSSACELKQLG